MKKDHSLNPVLGAVWKAMIASFFIFLFLIESVIQVPEPETPLGEEIIVFLLGFMAVMNLVISFVLPKFMHRQVLNNSSAYKEEDKDIFLKRSEFVPRIIGWAMCDSVAVFGIIAYTVTGHKIPAYIFIGSALFCMVLQRPSSPLSSSKTSHTPPSNRVS